jgi:hypothetical protein
MIRNWLKSIHLPHVAVRKGGPAQAATPTSSPTSLGRWWETWQISPTDRVCSSKRSEDALFPSLATDSYV